MDAQERQARKRYDNSPEGRRRIHRRRRTYIRSEAGFVKNLREIDRLRANLGSAKNSATAAALERREDASRRWANGETTR